MNTSAPSLLERQTASAQYALGYTLTESICSYAVTSIERKMFLKSVCEDNLLVFPFLLLAA